MRENGGKIPRKKSSLTPRDRQIIKLIRLDYSNKLIAYDLNLTEGTVAVYIHNLIQKLGVNSRVGLAIYARDRYRRKYVGMDRHAGLLDLIEQGLDYADVAARLQITEGAVKTAMYRIRKKIGITSRREIVEWWKQKKALRPGVV